MTLTRSKIVKPRYYLNETKFKMVKLLSNSNLSLRAFAAQNNLHPTTLYRWKTQVEILEISEVNLMYEGQGRPRALDGVAEREIITEVTEAYMSQKSFRPRTLNSKIREKAVQTKARRGLVMTGELHQRTVRDYKKRMKIDTVVCQNKTAARIEAEADPRNVYSMHVMVKAACTNLNPNLIMNWDSTQFVVGDQGNNVVVRIKTEESVKVVATGQSESALDFAIKLFHFHNADGYVAPPVFVIADPYMQSETFEPHRVEELVYNTDLDGFGYLVFCPTRVCNGEFYKWYIKDVVCPWVEVVRKSKKLVVRVPLFLMGGLIYFIQY